MTEDALNTQIIPETLIGKYDFPVLKRENDCVPCDIIPFHQAKTHQNKNVGVHFYIDDYQFERVWKSPQRYIKMLKEYQCVFSPDFSLFFDMPLAVKIWNVYRSRLIGNFWQSHGIRVVPTLQWAEQRTFDFCFDGIEKNGIVSVSTLGSAKNKVSRQYWKDGMTEAIKRIQPQTILLYGCPIDFDFKNIQVIYFKNNIIERLKKYSK